MFSESMQQAQQPLCGGLCQTGVTCLLLRCAFAALSIPHANTRKGFIFIAALLQSAVLASQLKQYQHNIPHFKGLDLRGLHTVNGKGSLWSWTIIRMISNPFSIWGGVLSVSSVIQSMARDHCGLGPSSV
jgi:hypothetical protein